MNFEEGAPGGPAVDGLRDRLGRGDARRRREPLRSSRRGVGARVRLAVRLEMVAFLNQGARSGVFNGMLLE